MNTKTETLKREDLIGITLAVLMFALQGGMLLAMSTDHVAGTGAGHGTMVAASADITLPGNPV